MEPKPLSRAEGIRGASKSTEFHLGYAALFLACLYCVLDDFGITILSWLLTGACNLYAIGRTIYKRNRQLYQPGVGSSEFRAILFSVCWTFGAFFVGLPGFHAASLTILSSGVWSLCAGTRKGLSNHIRINNYGL